MSDYLQIIDIVEKGIMSFDEFSGFPGVGLTGNIQNLLSKDKTHPFIKINEEDDGITINCEIRVYFGVNIPQLCYDIQTRVKRDCESLTDVNIKAINIKIDGIDRDERQSQ